MDLREIVEAKRAEIEALGIDFSAWEPRKLADLPICERDYGERTSPHGDPLAALFAAAAALPAPSDETEEVV